MTREARSTFLASNMSCGIDVFFGGGSYDLIQQADAGHVVPTRVLAQHPEWFRDDVIPREFAGEQYWDEQGRWIGNVLSNYGILFNRDALKRLGIERPPQQWSDLADPRYAGELALADPTKSSSIAKAFDNLVQQQIQRRLATLRRENSSGTSGLTDSDRESRAIREGWLEGMRLLQALGANARYFTDSSQKPPIDVAQGDCAAGICIDFYGRSQAEATSLREAVLQRLGFVTPKGGTVSSVDPIALLRGAPHRETAELFIEYTLTMDGQKLWNFRPGTPGGPQHFALRRLPVRRDFYQTAEWKPLRSDPDADPFSDEEQLISRPEWTEHVFREMAFIVRVMTLDTHRELTDAWRAIHAAPESAKRRALAKLQDFSAVTYDRAATDIKQAMSSKNRVDELECARRLGDFFRANYAAAKAEAAP
jgi:ABC-type Fe3+ transport system substrate-binding protein